MIYSRNMIDVNTLMDVVLSRGAGILLPTASDKRNKEHNDTSKRRLPGVDPDLEMYLEKDRFRAHILSVR